MYKVIVCGLRYVETLCGIENFLDSDYQIIGYADIDKSMNYLSWSGGARSPFYTLEELRSLSFDYIILGLYGGEQLDELVKKLKALGYDSKIVIPVCLKLTSVEKCQPDIVEMIQNVEKQEEFFGIILGLSYSFSGLDKDVLSKKFFDFSFGGRDMYYNLKLLEYAFSIGKFSQIKMALLMFPYYYFDYDQSQSHAQYVSGQIFGVHRLNDWHNFEKAIYPEEVKNYIKFMTDNLKWEDSLNFFGLIGMKLYPKIYLFLQR